MKALDFKLFRGKKFGRLTIYSIVVFSKRKFFLVVCDCGSVKEINTNKIMSGHTKSCGCLRKEISTVRATKHGLSKHPLYATWTNIISRCYNPNTTHYSIYGGKGVKMCEEWRNSFKCFLDWALNNGWQENLSVDRIKVDGNYEPGNCRWATDIEQANNRTNNKHLTFNNITKTISEWCRDLNISECAVRNRVTRGNWSIEDALSTPVRKGNYIHSKKIFQD